MSSFEEEQDYRNIISEIDEILHEALPESKIVIIVDDIERCSDNNTRQILFFIKEVATMIGCISLF